MEKTLKIWQFAMGSVVFAITVITMVVNLSNKIETQRLRIEFLESTSRDHALQLKDVTQQTSAQFKEINSKLTDILVMMQNKADVKKK